MDVTAMDVSAEVKTPLTQGENVAVKPQEAAAANARPAQTPEAAVPRQEAFSDLLQSYGFKNTEQNKAMLSLMLDNGISLSKENVTRMNQALKLTDSPEKALFLLTNGIRLNSTNAAQLEGLAAGQNRISEQIANLLKAVSDISDPVLRGQLFRLLGTVQGADTNLPGASTQGGAGLGLAGAGGNGLPGGAQAGNVLGNGAAGTLPGTGAAHAEAAGVGGGNAGGGVLQAGSANGGGHAGAGLIQGAPMPVGGHAGEGAMQAGGSPIGGANAGTGAPQAGNAPAGEGTPQARANPTNPAGAAASQAGNINAGNAASQGGNINAGNTAQPGSAASPGGNAHPGTASTIQGEATNASAATQGEAPPPANGASPLLSAGRGANPPSGESAPPTDAAPREAPTASSPQEQAAPSLRLSFKLSESTPSDIDRFINTLRDTMREIQRNLTDGRPETPETARVLREAVTLSEQIDFMAQIKNQIFVQMPVYHNGQETPTALHVYKDAKNEKKSADQTYSALIALDTSSLGHFETYVQKKARSVSCQFRLRDKNVEQLVRTHLPELNTLLNEYHYTLDAFSFLPPGEAFTVLDAPDLFEGREKEASGDAAFVFDQKV